MIKINLLPVREERRRADVRRLLLVMAAGMVSSALAAGIFHWRMGLRLAGVQQAVAATQKQIDRFGPQLKQVEAFRKAKAEIERKLDVIQRLDESRSGPVHVLDELATRTPERLWLTEIEARDRKLTLHGMSLDNELVAVFLTRLNDSPYFKNVELLETQAKEMDGYNLNAFEVSATITSPAAEKRATEKGGATHVAAASIGR